MVEEQVLNSYVIYLSEKIFLGQVLPATVVVESNRIKDVLPGRVEVPGALLNMHRVSKTASTYMCFLHTFCKLFTRRLYEEIECFETDVIWGGVTVLLIFLPGAHFAQDVSEIISKVMQNKVGCCTLYCLLLLPTMLVFPVVLILVKLVSLITPGSEWKRNIIWLTSMEGEWESSMQLLLTLFIIFSIEDPRGGKLPLLSPPWSSLPRLPLPITSVSVQQINCPPRRS